MDDFNAFFHNNVLIDILPQNGLFTWTNRRNFFLQIAERLDRFFTSSNWVLGQYSLLSEILPWEILDHFPTSLNISSN